MAVSSTNVSLISLGPNGHVFS
ncbi:MAG: hypothetical protein QOD39_1817, partial [Mycobacterium sp.]|nr:hypothetical protein [Mycobacterium sp.]